MPESDASWAVLRHIYIYRDGDRTAAAEPDDRPTRAGRPVSSGRLSHRLLFAQARVSVAHVLLGVFALLGEG